MGSNAKLEGVRDELTCLFVDRLNIDDPVARSTFRPEGLVITDFDAIEENFQTATCHGGDMPPFTSIKTTIE